MRHSIKNDETHSYSKKKKVTAVCPGNYVYMKSCTINKKNKIKVLLMMCSHDVRRCVCLVQTPTHVTSSRFLLFFSVKLKTVMQR